MTDWFDSDIPKDDNEKIIDKREFLDKDGNDIYKKRSADKKVEESIKKNRNLKIKNNKWNKVDYVDYGEEKIVINPKCYQFNGSFEDVEFEKKFHEIIKNSKYKAVLLSDEKITINYQIVNDMLIYCYARMKVDYPLCRIFVLMCEYCGIGLQTMWKRISSYLQLQILEELKDVSKLPGELLNDENKLF